MSRQGVAGGFSRAAVIVVGFGVVSSAGEPPPLTPARVAALALAHSPAAAAAAAGREESGAAARLATRAFRPSAWLSTTPGYSGGLPGGTAGRLPAVATVELRQTAYDRARRADVLEAEAHDELQARAVETAKQDAVRSALLTYARCWLDDVLVSNAVGREEAAAAGRARAVALEHEGRLATIDVERAALGEAQARQQRLDRESDRDLDRMELRQLIGQPPNAPLALGVDPLRGIPEPAEGEDLATALHNDAMTTALGEAQARWDRIESLQRRWWIPAVELDAQYSRLVKTKGYDDFYRTFKADDWSVGVSISLPLWTGGRTAAAAARAHAQAARLEQEGRARGEQLALLVRRAEASVGRAASALSLKQRALGLADEDLRLGRVLESEKRLGPADIGARETARADAGDDVVRAELDLIVARMNLLEVRGELLSAFAAGSDGPAPGL